MRAVTAAELQRIVRAYLTEEEAEEAKRAAWRQALAELLLLLSELPLDPPLGLDR